MQARRRSSAIPLLSFLILGACGSDFPPTPDVCALRVRRVQLSVTSASPLAALPVDCAAQPNLPRDAAGEVACVLDVVLPAVGRVVRCEDLASGSTLVDVMDDDVSSRSICRLPQLVATRATPPVEPGWYYDDVSSDVSMGGCAQVVLTEAAWPPVGSDLRLECLVEGDSDLDGGC